MRLAPIFALALSSAIGAGCASGPAPAERGATPAETPAKNSPVSPVKLSNDTLTAQAPIGAAPAPAPGPAPAAGGAPARSLHDRLGGEKAIAALVDETLARAAADPALEARFAGANLPKFRKGFVDTLGQGTGGPQVYKGASLKAAHSGMGITEAEYTAFARHVGGAAEKLGLGATERADLAALFERWRKEVVARTISAEERLGRFENRLAAIEQRLADLVARLDACLPSGGANGPPPPALAPAPIPDPATVNPAFKGEKWTAEEKSLAPALVRRFGEASSRGEGEPRDDLIGQRLPKTRFVSSSGDVVDLRDFEGKRKVVLVVLRGFTGSICIHCSAQTLALSNAVEKFRAAGAEVVLIYPGPAESVPAFVNAAKNLRQGFVPKLPILLDVDLSAVRALRIEGGLAKPTSLVVDEAGIIRYVYVGRQPADRPSASDLLAAIERLARGTD